MNRPPRGKSRRRLDDTLEVRVRTGHAQIGRRDGPIEEDRATVFVAGPLDDERDTVFGDASALVEEARARASDADLRPTERPHAAAEGSTPPARPAPRREAPPATRIRAAFAEDEATEHVDHRRAPPRSDAPARAEPVQRVEATPRVEPAPRVEPVQRAEAAPRSEPPPRAEPVQRAEAPPRSEPPPRAEPAPRARASEPPPRAREPARGSEPAPTRRSDPPPPHRADAPLAPRGIRVNRSSGPAADALAARPRRTLENWGTDAAGFIAQRAKIQDAEARVPETSIPALRPLATLLGEKGLLFLERVLSGAHEVRGADANASPKRALERLLFGRELGQLRAEDQARLLRLVVEAPSDASTPRALVRVLETVPLARWSEVERRRLVDLFVAVPAPARGTLASLAERRVRMRSALEDRDASNAPLVETLAILAERGAQPETTALLPTLAHPEALERADVIGVVSFALAQVAPAEFVRLLAARARRGALELPGGATVDAAPRRADDPPEAGLHDALERLATLVHPRAGAGRASYMMPGGHGIDADVLARALGQLFGRGYNVIAGPSAITRQLERTAADPDRWPPTFVSLLHDGGERLFVFHGLSDDHLALRSPHGGSGKPAGARRPAPDRVVDDPARGLDRVSRAVMSASAGVALIPRAESGVEPLG
jgi:hypothetical protein